MREAKNKKNMRYKIYDTKSEKFRDDLFVGQDEGVYLHDECGITEIEGCKVLLSSCREDKNGHEIFEGFIIDIGQTINGERNFLIKSLIPLDIRYGFDINIKYEYDATDLLTIPSEDLEIVGFNLNA